jgi:DNA-3-methyladenine glycosylase I
MPPTQVRPKNLAGYLDSMTMRVFEAGMSWKVVEAKWSGIQEAFHGFDPEWVADMSPTDVDHLANDPTVIRNRRKIEATVANAHTMLDLDKTHRGFRRYLESFSDYDALSKDLQRQFHFLGESGVWNFLWSVDEAVPPYQEWAATHLPPKEQERWSSRS